MDILVKAKSSGDEPYNVKFTSDGESLKVLCDCQAGMYMKLCKHKTELIAGDASRLYDTEDESKLKQIQELVARAEGIREVAAQIAESERIIKSEQSKNKKTKKKFESILKDGALLS